jgi:tRNA nucleotidyltransferase (CCA-adding enzyme)
MIAQKAEELAVREEPLPPVLLGRHLVQAGLEPGPALGSILEAAYEAQLAGKITDLNSAFGWVLENFELPETVRAALRERSASA